MTNTLQEIEIAALADHPKNPRLVMREDVIDGIVANLNGHYPQKHALHVRPQGDGFEILSGHHRKRAAEKAGFDEVWCWVEEMDDDAAFMELATSNNQGELDAIEIGIHVYQAVPTNRGGIGGGLKAYSNVVGKAQQTVSEYRNAGAVVSQMNTLERIHFIGKAKHLSHIHKLPEECWQEAVEIMLKKGWSAKDTGEKVKSACNGIKELVATQGWITPVDAAFLVIGDNITPTTIKQIAEKIGEIRAYANDHKGELDQYAKRKEIEPDFYEAKIATKAISVRYFAELHQELVDIVESMESHWLHGNWADHLDTIKDSSIDLVLTDPPYGMEYVSNRRKDKHKPIHGDGSTDAFSDSVHSLMPKLKDNAHILAFVNWRNEAAFVEALKSQGLTVKGSLVWVKNNHTAGDLDGGFAPKHERIIHAVKGKPKIYSRCADVLECAKVNTDRHPTEKPVALLEELIEACTVKGQLIADPFAGVASTPVACVNNDRKYWACEIDEDYHREGSKRLES